jgi:3-keto-5-aminohexanoate cleavage enzyme
MEAAGAHPEFECFDVGIVRSVGMFLQAGMLKASMGIPEYNLVMGVASGMPCDADLLSLLPRWIAAGAVWQATLIGREEIWPVHQKTAELGGMLRTGLEDSFYLPDGERAKGNGQMIEALARCAERAGRAIATPAQARVLLGLTARA